MPAKVTLQSRPNVLKKDGENYSKFINHYNHFFKSSLMESCSCVVVFIWSFAGHISHLISPVLEYV